MYSETNIEGPINIKPGDDYLRACWLHPKGNLSKLFPADIHPDGFPYHDRPGYGLAFRMVWRHTQIDCNIRSSGVKGGGGSELIPRSHGVVRSICCQVRIAVIHGLLSLFFSFFVNNTWKVKEEKENERLELSCFLWRLRDCVVRCLHTWSRSASSQSTVVSIISLSFFCDAVGKFEYSRGDEDIYTIQVRQGAA